MRKLLMLVPAALVVMLASCAHRSVQYTLTKTFSTQNQIDLEQQRLTNTEGVNKAIINISSGDVVTLELYVDKNNPRNALAAAADLGYRLVHN